MLKRGWYGCAFLATLVMAPAVAIADGGGPDIDLPPDEAVSGVGANPVQIGGYGEMHFNRVIPENGEKTSEIDFHRMVVYLGRQFDANIRFYSEIEIEHSIAGDGKVGEVAIEQAFVEYQLADESSAFGVFGIRAGIVLVPMGIINQWHEPPIFHGVERPKTDTVIIPSTWREGGVGIVGELAEGLRYELYLVGGLDASGFSAATGLRGGRQKVSDAITNSWAITGRVEFEPKLGVVVGGRQCRQRRRGQ